MHAAAHPTEIQEILRQDEAFVLYRSVSGVDRSPLLVLTAAVGGAFGDGLQRLEQEYAHRDELDAEWAARPLALLRDGGRPMLVLADPGGDLLSHRSGRPWEVAPFLRVAIGIAVAIGRMHERGLIHKDLKPANILVDPVIGTAWLTGFAMASLLPREHQAPRSPDVIAGTFAYMAPEQTGRMNRSIDSRSDLYALGVTLYELLTGALPFTAADPIEWIHCHIARQPVPPCERLAEVPAQLSAIVMKLLAKAGEDRYQTAMGVEADLRRCLAAWESNGRIDLFAVGLHDASDRLLIPERLYGRETEIAALLAAFDRVVTHGGSELMLVSGYSGIGKSSVVNELHKVIVLPRGIFISGKFDLHLKSTPYSTLAHAFQGLIRQIMNGGEEDVGRWREAIREALGNHGSLLTGLIPELVQVIGSQPPVAVLSALETQVRFQMVFQRFVSVFARAEHPLVIFIDDLQWLDQATLTLIEHLITHPDTRHLLLIGAYRDNEVGSGHPLLSTLRAIRRTNARVDEIALSPLSVDDINQLLCDSLRCASTQAWALSDLVHQKTGGNPFFAGQFLTSLAEEGLLRFDLASRTWTWDLDGIRSKGSTDSLVDLMIGRLRRLPSATQDSLKLLACLGNQADFMTLVKFHNGSDKRMHASFRAAVRAGAIYSQDGSYRFLHDRVQEAAYALIELKSRAPFHLRIGNLMLKEMTDEKGAEKIFDVVNQLNLGSALVSGWAEKQRVAELNLRAGRKAKASTAYTSACSYLAAGMALLTDEGWQRCYDLTLGLYLERAESELLSSNLEQAAGLIEELLQRGRSKVDRAEAYRLRMVLQLVHGDYGPAVRTALDCLRMFGLEFPKRPTEEQVRAEYGELRRNLGERSIESLVDLPLLDDPEMRAAMNLFAAMGHLAFHTDGTLFQMIACWMVKLTLRHGTSEFSTIGYGALAIVLGPIFGRPEDGERFGRLAVDVAELHGFTTQKAGAHFLMQMAAVWTRPIEYALDCLDAAMRSARETGEMIYACYSREQRLTDLLARGDPLDRIWSESVAALEFVRKHQFGQVVVLSIRAFVQLLRGQPSGDPAIDGVELEARMLRRGVPVVICFHWILQLQWHFLMGDPETALEFAAKAKPLLWSARLNLQSVDYYLYHSLGLAAVFPTSPMEKQADLKEGLSKNLRSLQQWAQSCPTTFSHKHAMLAAEIARVEGRDTEALRLYTQAIRLATEHGFVQDQALANELAARFCLASGLESVGQTYLRDARESYSRWGAIAKVAQLDQTYPGIERPAPSPLMRTIEAPAEQFDVATVVKMSQTLSGEIVLESLIGTLMMIAVEHAGAERGLLVLRHGDEQRIEAEASTSRDGVIVQLRAAQATSSDLPVAVLQHVALTRTSVNLDDARMRNAFSDDDYIVRKQPRSILCLPLVKQAELIGILYLENKLASHAFTAARYAVLNMLSSQAAISLQNARLYAQLEQEITERKREQEEMLKLQRRLRHAQQFEAMGTLAGGIAHDFNNILGAILGFGERALRDADQGSRLRHDLHRMVAAGERGRALVDSILSFSRSSAGARVPVHVERVVREAIDLLQAKLPFGVKLKTRLRAGRAAMLGDPTQLHQVLMNLGTNGVQAMPGGGTLSVTLESIDFDTPQPANVGAVEPGEWLVLRVTDDGAGIAPEIIDLIFDPFFTTKEAGVGTGLGLSLVLRIVNQVGGAIAVESTVGTGSVFTVYLPRAGEAPDDPDNAESALPRGAGQRLLVVDDEEPLLTLMTETLAELGYISVGFVSSVAALDAFRAKPESFDALITDARMPGISGAALISEVRRMRPSIPVVIVSGYVGAVATGRPDSERADEVLKKPLSARELATSLSRIFS